MKSSTFVNIELKDLNTILDNTMDCVTGAEVAYHPKEGGVTVKLINMSTKKSYSKLLFIKMTEREAETLKTALKGEF